MQTPSLSIQNSKWWKDKFIQMFYTNDLADKQSREIVADRLQRGIAEIEPCVKECIEAGLRGDRIVDSLINDYNAGKEILEIGMRY